MPFPKIPGIIFLTQASLIPLIFAPHTCCSYNVFRLCAANCTIFSIMYEESMIDLFCESVMIWATTGRVCEDLYFSMRHYCFRILAALNCRWLPFIRQAEQQLKPYKEHLHPQYTWIEQLGRGLRWPMGMLCFPIVVALVLTLIRDFPLNFFS